MHRRALTAALLLAIAATVIAVRPADARPKMADPAHIAAQSEGFLAYHPDLRWRKEGLGLYEDGKLELAYKAFLRSSRYADKGAQAMVAEMLWKGEGVERDRALAYAWMDLAAERNYPDFVKLREYYWQQLDARERERAIAEGREIYADFGDDVAKPRLERELEKGRRQITGSRTGFKGALTIYVPSGAGWVGLSGEQYYSDRFWKADQYFEWQDQVWRDQSRGRVEVGALEDADMRSDPGAD
jgi:hypothetical protein